MRGPTDETVGPAFSQSTLQSARDQTLKVIEETAKRIVPGTTERQARAVLKAVQTELGAPKSWHPPQIRFGENTLLAFGETGAPDVTLRKDDIFFLDIGPIFEDHEGDVGRPFTVGNHPDMRKCCEDAEAIWHEVHERWQKTGDSGRELYTFAEQSAERRGWVLSLKKANGHRIADFPHAARRRGSIEEFAERPAADRWILEIQIRHPTEPFGAFYEDLLN